MECDKNKAQILQDPTFSDNPESIDTTKSLPCSKTKNYIRYVAPVGVLILTLTFYILILIIQQTFNNVHDIKSIQTPTSDNKSNLFLEKANESQKKLTPQDCKEIEVCHSLDHLFSKKVELQNSNECSTQSQERVKNFKNENNKAFQKKDIIKENKISKKSNGKNGNMQKIKKTVKVKAITKKDQSKKEQKNQKSYAAEPIIYIFAIVFIYLLLKAASDINQHYKSQSKGDKRYRRCSLQSYAQAHKQDRRFSKDGIKTIPRLMEMRSISVDRYTIGFPEHIKLSETQLSDRKLSSLNIQDSIFHRTVNTDGKELSKLQEFKSIELSSNRRSSVPTSFNYHGQKINSMSTVSVFPTMRRTSVVSGSGSFDEKTDPFIPETKRRVRMINRH